MRRFLRLGILSGLLVLILSGCQDKQRQRSRFITDNRFTPFTPSKDMEADFKSPPDYARPWAFWWWLEGNIDKEGIREDLVAMKRVGIQTALIYDAGSSAYKAVKRTPPGPDFMSKPFNRLFKYAAKVADSLGLHLSLNITSGWNDGGSWVTPEHAAKKITWSTLRIKGPAALHQKLPLPGNVFVWEKDSLPYFWPVAALAVPIKDASAKKPSLKYFAQKAVHNVRVPQTPNGFNWNIFLQEDRTTLGQYSAKSNDIINISEYVDSLGNIRWNVPDGEYEIMWFGYTCTGSRVSTSGPGGEGLAIDYMDSSATVLQFNHVPLVLINEVKSLEGGLKYLHDDSWELGAANWTKGFIRAFKQSHGYDPVPYLPVIAGEVIDNKAVSNRFLYDFRRTIADLIAANHYGCLKTLAHLYDLGIHPEGGGPHPAPIDALKNLGINDIPMGEFWAKVKTHRVADYQRIFVKQSASAAHIYGKRFVQEEGPTSIGPQWEMDPRRLKPTIDRAFCEGMNRIVFHTFTHSPKRAGKPGYEYFAGSHFNPNITWWQQAPAYVDYISRCEMLLQQGAFVGDVCFYYGDNVPNQVHLKRINPSLGEGYDYDWTDTQVLLDSMYTKDHKIYLDNGMHYEVLVLPDREAIPLKVLKKVKQLVQNGATVIGPKPQRATGLSGYPGSDKSVKEIADELWGDNSSVKEQAYGKGKMVWGKTIREVLKERGIRPDFIAEGKKQLQDVDYIHRHYKDYDIYFVCNWKDTAQWFTADFRVSGKSPALWYPNTGKIVPQEVYTAYEDHTSLPVYLPAYGSVFVVFKHKDKGVHIDRIQYNNEEDLYPFQPGSTGLSSSFISAEGHKIILNRGGDYTLHFSDGKEKHFSISSVPEAINLDKDWEVSFDTAWGGPAKATFDRLISWPESTDKGIKYYSGTAVYRHTFSLPGDAIKDSCQVRLDLGKVYNLAEVKVNGQEAGILWKYPFSVDITPYLKEGANDLTIKVVNLWPNRIIGDLSLPAGQRYTHTNVVKFTKDYPLLPSGLIGPVSIRFKPFVSVNEAIRSKAE